MWQGGQAQTGHQPVRFERSTPAKVAPLVRPFRDLRFRCGAIQSWGPLGCKCLVAFLLLGLNLAWLRREILVAVPATPYAQTLGFPMGLGFDTTWPGGARGRVDKHLPLVVPFWKPRRSLGSGLWELGKFHASPPNQPTCIRSKSCLSARFWRFQQPCRVLLRRCQCDAKDVPSRSKRAQLTFCPQATPRMPSRYVLVLLSASFAMRPSHTSSAQPRSSQTYDVEEAKPQHNDNISLQRRQCSAKVVGFIGRLLPSQARFGRFLQSEVSHHVFVRQKRASLQQDPVSFLTRFELPCMQIMVRIPRLTAKQRGRVPV